MESKQVLIDTNILIDYFQSTSKEKTLLYSFLSEYRIAISTITEFEISIGINDKNKDFFEKLLQNIIIIPFDSSCAFIASKIYRDIKKSSSLIEVPDIFIAAIAVSFSIPLSTLNKEHFSRIEGLTLL
ncbi:MAG: hypothetical protein A2014_02850 [Spirochaetes bacterium GWF1_49_6]|nr:MAG: hypothetical protein A2014_02850 [Spirochaetes bacterium GWF1_49_6]